MSLFQSEADRWKAWDTFVEATPDAGFMQTSWYADFRASVGYQSFCVTLKYEETIVGGALVMKWSYAPQRCFYYISDGSILPQDESTVHQVFFFFSSRRRHTRLQGDWSSDVCSSD